MLKRLYEFRDNIKKGYFLEKLKIQKTRDFWTK